MSKNRTLSSPSTLRTPEAREKVLKGNHQRLFDAARVKAWAWEKANVR